MYSTIEPQSSQRESGPDLVRRRFLQLAAVGGVGVLWPQSASARTADRTIAPSFTFAGGATADGILTSSMVAKHDIGKLVNLGVSQSPDMRRAQFVGEQRVDNSAIVRHSVFGLKPNRTYYAQLFDEFQQVGNPVRFTTMPSSPHSWTRKIAVVSCMGNAVDPMTSEVAWADIEAWGADDIWHLGDFGYWGQEIGHGDTYQKDLSRYAHAMTVLPTMASAIQSAGLNAVTISDHELTGNGDPKGGAYNSKESLRELIAFQKLMPVRTYGDTRVPRRGRYYSYDMGTAVRVIVTDFRTPDRSNIDDPDGPSKTMFGQTQLSWLFATMDPYKLNILINETAWLADPWDGRRAGDKPWAYRYEQQRIADFIQGGEYHVAWVGGDRHYVGYLAGETGEPHNTLGGFPCYISSGISKGSLDLQRGELMTWQFGGNMTDPQRSVCGYMQLTLTYDGPAKNITLQGLGRAVLDTTQPPSQWQIENIPGGTAVDWWHLGRP